MNLLIGHDTSFAARPMAGAEPFADKGSRRAALPVTARQRPCGELPGVVKNDAERVALTGAYSTDAMTHVHTVNALRSLDGPAVDGE